MRPEVSQVWTVIESVFCFCAQCINTWWTFGVLWKLFQIALLSYLVWYAVFICVFFFPSVDGLVVCHLPFGPTAYFTLYNVVMRHDVPDIGTMSEAYPHLIFHNFTSRLGRRVRYTGNIFWCLNNNNISLSPTLPFERLGFIIIYLCIYCNYYIFFNKISTLMQKNDQRDSKNIYNITKKLLQINAVL